MSDLPRFLKHWQMIFFCSFAALILWCNPTMAKAAGSTLAAPILTAAVNSSTVINLAWTAPSTTVTGYVLQRSLNGTKFTQLASLGQNVTSYQNTLLAPGTTYYYRVQAVAGRTSSPYSNIAKATTPANTTPPTVSITSPIGGTTYLNAQTVALIATATDNSGKGIKQVVFYEDNILKGTVTTSPYRYNWTITTADNGTHNWTAVATDNGGNVSLPSSAVALKVNIPVIFTIAASAGTGGAITPSGSVAVTSGSNQTFTITSNIGYKINQVSVDGSTVTLGAGNTYLFGNVTANHTIAASFTLKTFTAL